MSELSPLSQLRVAIKSANPVLARQVLQQHPDLVHDRDEKGATPLHLAAQWQHLSLVSVLMESGADPTLKDSLGRTPKDVAHWYGEYANGAYTDTCLRIIERLSAAGRAA
jgi:ankyrin repeat protein